jgi:cytidyltransferase-like protein
MLWSDEVVRKLEGTPPKFPQQERIYLLDAIRYVSQVVLVEKLTSPTALPEGIDFRGCTWAVDDQADLCSMQNFCNKNGLTCRVISRDDLKGFPIYQASPASPASKKVLVTGCYDWLHSGHVRFFEEVSELGDLYVVVGHDANVRHLKGEGHPLFGQDERRYMVQAVRFVHQALVSSGWGWMDAEPEINQIHPDIYAVNEDGDKPEKRAFTQDHGLEYVVLKRQPKEGLPRRESTHLRGF